MYYAFTKHVLHLTTVISNILNSPTLIKLPQNQV